jgi:hypothetical protein
MANSNDPNTQKVDYGKSTLFRFSIINDKVPSAESTKPIVVRPKAGFSSSNARTMSSEEPQTIVPVENVEQLKEFNTPLFNLGEWISSCKSELNTELLEQKSTGITALTQTQEDSIWLYVVSQVESKSETWLLSKSINMLRANAVIIEIADFKASNPNASLSDDEEYLIQLANAPIGIPDDAIPEVNPAKANPTQRLNPQQEKMLKSRQTAALASIKMKNAKIQLDKIEELKTKHQQEYNDAYISARAEYDAQVQEILEQLPPRTYDENDQEVPVPKPVLPEFEFSFPVFDFDYIKSDECNKWLNLAIESIKATNPCCQSIEKLQDYFVTQKDKATELYFKALPVKPAKVIQYNGHQISLDFRPPHNSLVAQVVRLLPEHQGYSLLFTQFSRNGGSKMGDLDLTLTVGENAISNHGKAQKVFETEEFVSFVVFENDIDLSESSDMSLEGTALSDNGELDQEISISLRKDVLQFFTQKDLVNSKSMQRVSTEDGDPGNDKTKLYGIKKIGVMDYMRVEQEVCCYVAGEVSHIENIMAREYKEKLSRLLTREEITTEESEEREDERTKDVSTTDRYEMHKEISQMLSKEQSQQIGVTAGMTASYNPGTYSIGVNAGTTMNFSNSSGYNQTSTVGENIAKEITQKATDRILKKVSYKRIAKMLREHEETNKHGFDNRGSGLHVTGIYRWVDKIFKNTLFNYGKRLIYEFSVPEPSKNFKYWMSDIGDDSNAPSAPTPPIDPKTLVGKTGDSDILEWSDIKIENYANIAAIYGADVEPCLDEYQTIGKSFADAPTKRMRGNHSEWDETVGSYKYEIEIPDGYACTNCWVNYSHVTNYRTNSWQTEANIQVDVRNRDVKIPNSWMMNFYGSSSGSDYQFHEVGIYVKKALPIGLTVFNVGSFSLSVVAVCKRTDEAFQKWQQNTYRAIMEAYRKKYQAYLDAKVAYQAPEKPVVDYNYNPGIGRAIEGRELKRLCIEMMSLPFSVNTSNNHYDDWTSCNLGYTVKRDPSLDSHAMAIKFFEEAFEWDLMSYTFLPYFYAQRTQWEELIKQKTTSDPLFEAFLQSGMANVRLTVRPGYERMALYFLDTGTIPPSKDFIPGGEADYYSSIIKGLEVLSDKDQIDKELVRTWETRVPTDLVILQSGARPLQQNGLPCVCKDGLATEGLGTGDPEDMNVMEPYTSDYGPIIKDVKDALVDVLNTVADITKNNSNDGGTPPQTP